MINALVSGKVIVQPSERTAKSGKKFYTITVAASTGGEDSVLFIKLRKSVRQQTVSV